MPSGLLTHGWEMPTGTGVPGAFPVISNMTPTPGVSAGDPGGFSPSFVLARNTPISFDVTDPIALRLVEVLAQFSDDVEADWVEVFDGTQFSGRFSERSSWHVITGGVHLDVLPRLGWSGAAVRLKVRAIDQNGSAES